MPRDQWIRYLPATDDEPACAIMARLLLTRHIEWVVVGTPVTVTLWLDYEHETIPGYRESQDRIRLGMRSKFYPALTSVPYRADTVQKLDRGVFVDVEQRLGEHTEEH